MRSTLSSYQRSAKIHRYCSKACGINKSYL
nr:MAG TPA: hypothetical protein [Bacteriophage sp.]